MEAEIGERFAEALAKKDRTALLDVLAPDVDFRALTPNKFWHETTAEALVDDVILGQWFEPQEHIEALEETETGSVADRNKLRYLVRISTPDGLFLVEQEAYFAVADDRISWLRILCSGYRRIDAGN
jgi:hypothetical protein